MSETFDWKTELRDVSQLKVRDKLDYAEIVRLQLNRCLMSKSEIERPELHITHVKGLLALLLAIVGDDEEFQKELDMCSQVKKVPKPEYYCGVLCEPIKFVEKEVTDYGKLLEVCARQINKIGMGVKTKETGVID